MPRVCTLTHFVQTVVKRRSVNFTGDRNANAAAANGSDKPVRVYADGVFDMYHIGHARVLE